MQAGIKYEGCKWKGLGCGQCGLCEDNGKKEAGIGVLPLFTPDFKVWDKVFFYRGIDKPPVWTPKAPQTREDMYNWTPDRMIGESWEDYQKRVKEFFVEQDKANIEWEEGLDKLKMAGVGLGIGSAVLIGLGIYVGAKVLLK